MKTLLSEIRELISTARTAVVRSVDWMQVLTNFEITNTAAMNLLNL